MSKYQTIDGLNFYRFDETYVEELEQLRGYFYMILDNVTILPENPNNRDIREMRANSLKLTIRDGAMTCLIREGYKQYDPNGVLMQEIADEEVEKVSWQEVLEALLGAEVCEVAREADTWTIVIAGEEDSYVIRLTGTADVEEWDRFLNK